GWAGGREGGLEGGRKGWKGWMEGWMDGWLVGWKEEMSGQIGGMNVRFKIQNSAPGARLMSLKFGKDDKKVCVLYSMYGRVYSRHTFSHTPRSRLCCMSIQTVAQNAPLHILATWSHVPSLPHQV